MFFHMLNCVFNHVINHVNIFSREANVSGSSKGSDRQREGELKNICFDRSYMLQDIIK